MKTHQEKQNVNISLMHSLTRLCIIFSVIMIISGSVELIVIGEMIPAVIIIGATIIQMLLVLVACYRVMDAMSAAIIGFIYNLHYGSEEGLNANADEICSLMNTTRRHVWLSKHIQTNDSARPEGTPKAEEHVR